jgi:acyl-CoA thioester hydrolase
MNDLSPELDAPALTPEESQAPAERIMLRKHRTAVRVRYAETDAQGHVHHAVYFTYFEMGRVELLRACGVNYRDFESQGLMLVVSEIGCRYYGRAFYDDLLTIETETVRSRGVRVEHSYRIYRGEELLVEGNSVVACVDATGRPRKLPPWLQLDGRTTAADEGASQALDGLATGERR